MLGKEFERGAPGKKEGKMIRSKTHILEPGEVITGLIR